MWSRVLIRLFFTIAPRAAVTMTGAGAVVEYQSSFVDLRDQLPARTDAVYTIRDPKIIQGLILHHTATGQGGSWKKVAQYHTEFMKWPELGYHFGVDSNGVVYQLLDYRKWSNHAQGHNKHTIAIALLGNYHDRDITPAMESSIIRLSAYLRDEYNLKYFWLHRDTKATACPGDFAARFTRPYQWGDPPTGRK